MHSPVCQVRSYSVAVVSRHLSWYFHPSKPRSSSTLVVPRRDWTQRVDLVDFLLRLTLPFLLLRSTSLAQLALLFGQFRSYSPLIFLFSQSKPKAF